MLLTEYQHAIPAAAYRHNQHLAAHTVATEHFDCRDEQVVLDVLLLQVDSIT
jgi:hypothetical protein